MRKTTIPVFATCVMLLASCGKANEAKSTVKDFIAENFTEDYDIDYFYDLDSTTYVTEPMLDAMRKNAEGNKEYKKGIKYADRKKKTLYYVPVRLEKGKEKVKHTFYMNEDLTEVVAFK